MSTDNIPSNPNNESDYQRMARLIMNSERKLEPPTSTPKVYVSQGFLYGVGPVRNATLAEQSLGDEIVRRQAVIAGMIQGLKDADAEARAAPETGERRESGWLVEDGGHTPRYRTMHDGVPVWTGNPNEALRFARRVDAELFSREDEDAWRVVEHQWITLDGEQAHELKANSVPPVDNEHVADGCEKFNV